MTKINFIYKEDINKFLSDCMEKGALIKDCPTRIEKMLLDTLDKSVKKYEPTLEVTINVLPKSGIEEYEGVNDSDFRDIIGIFKEDLKGSEKIIEVLESLGFRDIRDLYNEYIDSNEESIREASLRILEDEDMINKGKSRILEEYVNISDDLRTNLDSVIDALNKFSKTEEKLAKSIMVMYSMLIENAISTDSNWSKFYLEYFEEALTDFVDNRDTTISNLTKMLIDSEEKLNAANATINVLRGSNEA